MLNMRSLVVVAMVSLFGAEPCGASRADVWVSLIATGCGTVFIGLGGMLNGLANNDDAHTGALYNTSELSVTDYSVGPLSCQVCGKGCTTYDFTASVDGNYPVYANNAFTSYNVTLGKFCGSTEKDALDSAQRTFPLHSTSPIFYLMGDPTQITFSLPRSSLWIGAIVLYGVGGLIFILGAGSTAFFCRC